MTFEFHVHGKVTWRIPGRRMAKKLVDTLEKAGYTVEVVHSDEHRAVIRVEGPEKGEG